MAIEYVKPMLDVGSPRVLNCGVLTRRILAEDPSAKLFFTSRPLNDVVLIKDTVPESESRLAKGPIGTKLYFPFNGENVYEGGRTIFAHDRHLEAALVESFGQVAITKQALAEDMRILDILDRLPSLDPFLLKDVFLNAGIDMNATYFDVSKDIWNSIEAFIVQRLEPLVKAAFPDTTGSDDKARILIKKIWEARDLEALEPLIDAFRLPKNEALEIFSAWKGINFYAFQTEAGKPLFIDLLTWLKNLEMPPAIPAAERNEFKAMLEQSKTQLRNEWQKIDGILRDYQDSYDKMFKYKTNSAEFVAFLKNSSKLYWDLGNSLGKTSHASYCWDVVSKRFPDRKMAWEPLREMIMLFTKIFKPESKPATSVVWCGG
jgi:hypothetical protein